MLRVILIAFLSLLSAPTLAAYKCESNGKTTYSETPCQGGKVIDVSDPSSPAEAAKIQHQTEQEKKKVKQLENARHKREATEESENRHIARTSATKKKKCATLEQRRMWAQEDLAKASGKSSEKAKIKARRANEKFQLTCGK